ncbi:MAG: flagellar basal body rod protein FlgB [Alphaproteobacteria bacterium]|nr:flagellar basal body rod protein FlgB [Alphaproteobacteria bacterium]MCL2506025.1 flagellar basal body rod protein FlgB [Alphaproteobacteria bacterium]
MPSSVSGVFDALSGRMFYLKQKQTVLAENIANSSTPNYKQLELQPMSFESVLQKAGRTMLITNPKHILPASMAGANARTFESKDTVETMSGNTVDIEGQMAEMSKTSMEHQTVAAIYKKLSGLFKLSAKSST